MHSMTWGHFIFHLSLSFIFVACFASFLPFRIWHRVRKRKAVEFEKSREPGFHPVIGSALGHMSETFLHVMFCMICFQITNLHLFHIYVCIYICVCAHVCINISKYIWWWGMWMFWRTKPQTWYTRDGRNIVNKLFKCTNVHWFWHPGCILFQTLLAKI